MKRVTKVIILIIISFALQSIVLICINNFYRSNKKVTYKWADTSSKKKSSVQVDISMDARNIEVSSTGKFVSYYLGDSIHVKDINKNKDNIIKLDVPISNASISWRIDDDKLMVITKKYSGLRVYTYDPKENQLYKNRDANNEWKLYPIESGYKVTGIEQNNKNTLIYLKLTKNDSKNYSFLKTFDITNEINGINLPIHNIGNYYIFKAENKVVFEDEVDKKIYMASNKIGTHEWHMKPLKIQGVTGLKLLAVDDNGIVYVGKLINNKISTVYTCNISTRTSEGNSNKVEQLNGSWNRVLLEENVDAKHIYISDIGDMYIIDNVNKKVINVKTGKEIAFKGEYKCMFGDSMGGGIISLDGNKLIEIEI
ncbi:hypothetical protein [Clostridium hydrogenum]|uniref:hypothetical protein n=1 Tax=Clostridium hydrogenum TaxID=2855764 RepID=UPI001F2C3DB6|nr:hypothetical protein [Clostridium hydrogenum]